MRTAATIASRDLRSIGLSPFGVGTAAGFAAVSGLLLIFSLGANQARLDTWFAPLFIVIGLLAALLTMRSFAEEERTGSLELLLTGPVLAWQVVIGKLLGAVGVLVAIMASTVVCPLLVAAMGHPDLGPIVTGYVGMLAVGFAFVAVGLAVSATTGNPLVAVTGTVAVLGTLWGAGLLARRLTGGPHTVLAYLSPANHLTGFLRGTLAATDAAYFLSFTIIGVLATVVILGRRH